MFRVLRYIVPDAGHNLMQFLDKNLRERSLPTRDLNQFFDVPDDPQACVTATAMQHPMPDRMAVPSQYTPGLTWIVSILPSRS